MNGTQVIEQARGALFYHPVQLGMVPVVEREGVSSLCGSKESKSEGECAKECEGELARAERGHLCIVTITTSSRP
jgi:hypothetical protein